MAIEPAQERKAVSCRRAKWASGYPLLDSDKSQTGIGRQSKIMCRVFSEVETRGAEDSIREDGRENTRRYDSLSRMRYAPVRKSRPLIRGDKERQYSGYAFQDAPHTRGECFLVKTNRSFCPIHAESKIQTWIIYDSRGFVRSERVGDTGCLLWPLVEAS